MDGSSDRLPIFFLNVTSIFQTVPGCEVNKPAHQDGLLTI